MFPFWETVIAPVLDAAGARRIVEIGALRGENTQLMLDHLGADAELHVIDPLPAFDPAEHEARFGGRYIFHRDISHDVLPTLPPMDVALIDGDHNWFTVYHELRMLSEVSRAAGRPLPGDDPPRRALALRPARPLLRAEPHPRGVPPALRAAGACSRPQEAAPEGRLQP